MLFGCISHYKCKLDIRHLELCLSRLRGSFGRTEKSVSMPGRMRKRLAVGLGQRTSNSQKSTTSAADTRQVSGDRNRAARQPLEDAVE